MIIDAQTLTPVYDQDPHRAFADFLRDHFESQLMPWAVEQFGGTYCLKVVASPLVPDSEIHLVSPSGHRHRIINIGAIDVQSTE